MKWLKGAPDMSGMNMYYVYYLLSIRFFPRKTGPVRHNSNCLRGDVKWYIGKCTKYFIDMHYQSDKLFHTYERWIHLALLRKLFLWFSKNIQAPPFCGLLICIWLCLGSVQSVILIATTKEGNVLLSKYFLNHIDYFCLHHHGHAAHGQQAAQSSAISARSWLSASSQTYPRFFILFNSYLSFVWTALPYFHQQS